MPLQGTDRAALSVGAKDFLAEALLMQSDADFPQGISAHLGRRHGAARLRVYPCQALVQEDDSRRRIIHSHEHGSDHHILSRREPLEVDQRALEIMRRLERAVVRLVHGPGSVVVEDRVAL
jgi:hypothetical protein